MDFTINGRAVQVSADSRTSLLDLLRDHLGLTGTKIGCNQGACGACTVLVEGERINACLALAVQYQGRSITTVEGLAKGENLHPLQQAFIEYDGFQCGYCTPGQLCFPTLADPPRVVGFDVPSIAKSSEVTQEKMNVLLHKDAPAPWVMLFEKALEDADPMIRGGCPTFDANMIKIWLTVSNVGSMRVKIAAFLGNLSARYQLEQSVSKVHVMF